MTPAYLQGGDAYQILDHPKVAGQTFRVDQAFTLQWIDLNLKLGFKTPEVIVEIYNAGADHLPQGDPISRSRYWLITQPLPTRDWLWYEPWGKTLSENHDWWAQPHLDPPDITFKNGAITLVNTGRTAQWIDTLLSVYPFPLVDASGDHLHFHHHSPVSYGGETYHWHSYTFKFEKGAELWTLEAIISQGDNWAPLNDDCGVTPLGSCFWEGKGPGVFDLTEKWIHCRTFHGLDADPTGWKLHHLHLRIEHVYSNKGGTLQNNFCGLARQQFTPVPYDDYDTLPSGYTWPNILYRVRFSMAPVLLNPYNYYFMRVVAFPGLLEMAHYWQYDKDDATYPQGIRLSSNDGGGTWTKHWNDDHLFAAFGTPPAPTPPPDPPLANWVVLMVIQTLTATGYKINCWTNVPCHLYMFWTPTEPQKHMRTRIVRGVSVLDTPAYCFVTWHENEQEEAGDTIYHTFIKEPWPLCETRWYTFKALVNNEWSPSAGPIFKKHRCEFPYGDPVWIECPLHQHTLGGYAKDINYAEVQTKDPVSWNWTTSEYIATSHIAPNYFVYRNGIVWDTTLIPAGSMIVQAYMHRYGYYPLLGGDVDFDCIWLNAVNWPGTVNSADYALWNGFRQIVALYRVQTDWTELAWHDIPLTPAGLQAIVPAGLTKMCSQTDVDYSDNPPPAMEVRRFTWYGLQIPKPQKLFVQYLPPL